MWFKVQNDQLIPPPVNFVTPQGTIMNFNKNPDAMFHYGWRDWEAQEVMQWDQQHKPISVQPLASQTFKAACAQFRQICHQIGLAIGNPDFKGGFDQMSLFAQSPVYSTIEGLKLGLAWSASNQNCKYEGSKIGLGQPAWWYKCWQLQNSDSKNEEE